jgi:mannosyltransferase OCH1-like enzyme
MLYLIVALILLSVLRKLKVRYDVYQNRHIPTKNNTIPKYIYQLCPCKEQLHPSLKDNIEHLKNLNPGYTHVLMDDADMLLYMSESHPDNYTAYRKINPAFGAARADFFRYLLLYDKGGIYLDIKSSATVPFDEMFDPSDEFILAHWPFDAQAKHLQDYTQGRGEYCQWFIIARPNHPFLYATLQRVKHNIENYTEQDHNNIGLTVLETTGPIAYTKAIYPILEKHKHKLYDEYTSLGLVYTIYWGLLSTFTSVPNRTHRIHTRRKDSEFSHYSKQQGRLILKDV